MRDSMEMSPVNKVIKGKNAIAISLLITRLKKPKAKLRIIKFERRQILRLSSKNEQKFQYQYKSSLRSLTLISKTQTSGLLFNFNYFTCLQYSYITYQT